MDGNSGRASMIVGLFVAVALLGVWVVKLQRDVSRAQADLRTLANMVSDLKIAAKAKE